MIRALVPEHVASHRPDLMELAMADARPVRESARFVLSQTEPVDFASACRSRLDAEARDAIRPGWIACLGETGGVGDFERVAAFLDHPRSRVRAAAVTAAGRLDRDRTAPAAARLLADSSGHVRRAAVAVLAGAQPSHWTATAYEILASGSERAQAAALGALTARGVWDAIPPLLHGLLTGSEEVRQRAWLGLCDWHRRHGSHGWLKPSGECRAEISRIWPHVRSRNDAPDWAMAEWRELKKWIEQLTEEAT
jgi:HEAT repeat protein